MKAFVGIKLEVEGFHNYPTASKNHGEEVGFLEYPHRHLFKIECRKRVNHNDRDEEFIILNRRVKQWILSSYPDKTIGVCSFGPKSCEMIAEEILIQFGFDSVKVSEDGENYAIVEQDIKSVRKELIETIIPEKKSTKPIPKIIFVIGEAFSGKTTYVQKNKEVLDCTIEVGKIVQEITSSTSRVFDRSLDNLIVQNIYYKIMEIVNNPFQESKHIYIVGCRQISILEGVLKSFDQMIDYDIIVMCVPMKVRRSRYEKMEKDKRKNKNLSFEEIEEGDNKIGVKDLMIHALTCLSERTKVVYSIED
jgi:hypothetical protein